MSTHLSIGLVEDSHSSRGPRLIRGVPGADACHYELLVRAEDCHGGRVGTREVCDGPHGLRESDAEGESGEGDGRRREGNEG